MTKILIRLLRRLRVPGSEHRTNNTNTIQFYFQPYPGSQHIEWQRAGAIALSPILDFRNVYRVLNKSIDKNQLNGIMKEGPYLGIGSIGFLLKYFGGLPSVEAFLKSPAYIEKNRYLKSMFKSIFFNEFMLNDLKNLVGYNKELLQFKPRPDLARAAKIVVGNKKVVGRFADYFIDFAFPQLQGKV